MTADAAIANLVDEGRLGQWMDKEGVPGAGAPLEYRYIGGGTQNVILEIRRGDFHCALRRPPLNPPPGRDEGILREWRIIAALRDSDVPHTRAIALCEDHSVLGCTFYLMEFVEGWSPAGVSEWPEPFRSDVKERRGLAFQLVDGIAQLSKVDWQEQGLGDLGRPDGFHDRQVDRWLKFLERVQTRDLPGLSEATEWLRRHRPLDFNPGLMHGDYQLANVMFGNEKPARLAAIIDWEMGTVGDPKLDLAWALQEWPDDTGDPEGKTYGFPTVAELVDYYSRESGRQVDDIDYYLVLARWKLGIVLEQGYSRAVQGEADNPVLLSFGDSVLDLMKRAAELAEASDFPAVS
jgi:aminoglycoside phosphotransferase (APT) family kinase protein